MRRLILLRHAKSDWPDGVRDEDRPLAPRGQAAAPRMGAYLASEGLAPDRALVSPARRTVETWERASAELGPVESEIDARIYSASASTLLEVVHALPDAAGTVLLIGHSPGIPDLAARLIGMGDRAMIGRLTAKYPTAGLTVLDFPCDSWAEVKPSGGRLERFVTPKTLGGVDED